MSTEQEFLYLFPERIAQGDQGVLKLDWGAEKAPFGAVRTVHYNGATSEVLVRHKALTSTECAKVIALGDARPQIAATLERGSPTQYRASTITWIEPDPDAQWLYHRLGVLFHEVNRRYQFDLTGYAEALQYTVYGPGDMFDWHIDLGAGTLSGRKLSMSVLLSEDDTYEGGDLEFINANRGGGGGIGTAVFFPSYMAHRVAPIVSGTRRSLVAWGYGSAFR